MPANTFVATAEAVVRAGAQPAFADVDLDYLLLDPGALEAALSQQTGAVIPVHLFGQWRRWPPSPTPPPSAGP